MALRVLISGCGIAGPALAYWLDQHGHAVTIVETASRVRSGGQAIDFRGPSLTVLEKMGILAEVRAHATNMNALTFVNEQGKTTARIPVEVNSGELEIAWADLARILHATVQENVECRFGVRIIGIENSEEHVYTEFSDGSTAQYDVVIGADGMHSGLRSLILAPQEHCVTQLGEYFCYFTMENLRNLDHESIFLQTPGLTVGLQAIDPAEPALAMLYMTAPDLLFNYQDTEGNRRLFSEKYRGLGWETPRILQSLATADPIYFGSIAQVHVSEYSRGRAALIGDAAWCPSPRSGMGTSLAMVAAYVLAHELREAGNNHKIAFEKYQKRLEPYVKQSKKLALASMKADNPKGILGMAARNFRHRARRIPAISQLFARQHLAVGRSFELPTY